jgi:PIN domain nuclease of toxin-antitoxin system
MTCLLDTHFLIWILSNAKRLEQFSWLDDYRPWGISPISLLELQILSETGRIELAANFANRVMTDTRFILDEAPLVTVVQRALSLSWTRDPFDRIIVAQHGPKAAVMQCRRDHNQESSTDRQGP